MKTNVIMTALSVDECRKISSPIREGLEVFDYEVRSAIIRMLAEADKSDVDSVLFLKAAGTVLLSIAAGLLANAADDEGMKFETEAFLVASKDAAEWAKSKKLRYQTGGEA